jgi:hypothetical protein
MDKSLNIVSFFLVIGLPFGYLYSIKLFRYSFKLQYCTLSFGCCCKWVISLLAGEIKSPFTEHM